MKTSVFGITTGIILALSTSPGVEASALLRISSGPATLTCDNSTFAGVTACTAAGFVTVLGDDTITFTGVVNGVSFGGAGIDGVSHGGNAPGNPTLAFLLQGEGFLINATGAARTITVDFGANNFTLPVGAGSLIASQTAHWITSETGNSQAFSAWVRNDNSLVVPGPGASGATATSPDCTSPGGLSQSCGSQSPVVPANSTAPFALTGRAVINTSGLSFANFTTSSVLTTISNPVVAADAAVSLGLQELPQRRFLYTITVANGGPASATGISVVDAIPAGTRFVSATPSQGTCLTPAPGAVGTMTCDLGNLAPSAQATVELLVDVIAIGQTTVTNTVNISTTSVDLNATNNSATLTDRLGGPR